MYLVDVPNILLQDNWDIKVYGFDSSYTKHSTVYNVVPRTRPENYVYSETEQLRWEQLEERIDQIEENGVSDEVVANAVEKYMDENDIKVDLTGYATEKYVDEAIDAIEHPTTDLTGYATEQYVQEQIEGIEHPTTDLTGYATEDYVGKKIAEAQLEGEEVDLSAFYTKTETNAEIKKAVDAIEHPTTDLSDYYTKSETNTAINNAKPDLSGYALKTEIPSTAGLATEKYVDDAIAAIEIPEGSGDGTTIIQSIKEVHVGSDTPTDESVVLWVDPDEDVAFATMTEVEAKGYQTAAQVQTAIDTALSAIGIAEEGGF